MELSWCSSSILWNWVMSLLVFLCFWCSFCFVWSLILRNENTGLVFLHYSWFGVLGDYWVVPNLKLWSWIVITVEFLKKKKKKLSQFDAALSLLIFVVKTVLDFPERNKGNTLMLWYFVVVWLRELRRHSFLVWFLIVKYKRDSELWTLCCEIFFGLISLSLDV